MKTYTLGLDAGNSEADIVIGHGRQQRHLTIPAFIGSGSLTELARIRGGSGRASDVLADGEYVLDCDHQSSFVGQLALSQSGDADAQRGSVNRYWSGHTLKLLMVLAGTVIKDRKFAVRVVTGLPVQVWTEETADNVAQALAGTHRFTLNGEDREMTVDGTFVIMEGAGALIAHGSADPVAQAVIDIGGQTTDLFWAMGQQPVLARCSGTNWGVESVADVLNAMLKNTARPLTPDEMRQVLRAHAAGTPPPELYVDGELLVLNGQVGSAVAAVAENIRSFVSKAWRSGDAGRVARDARNVLLIGGGPYYFAKELKKLIPHLTIPAEAELANARGYRDLADALGDDDWLR